MTKIALPSCVHLCANILYFWDLKCKCVTVKKVSSCIKKKMSGNFEKHHFFCYVWYERAQLWCQPDWFSYCSRQKLRFCFQCHSSNSRLVALKVWQQVVIKTYHFIGTKYEKSFFSDMLMNSPFKENQNGKTSFLGMLHLLFLLLSCLFFWDKQ